MTLQPTDLLTVIAIAKKEAQSVVAALPADGQDGADGKDGQDGRNGDPGRDGKNGQDGRDGKDGRDGQDGKDGLNGTDGRDGLDGKSGADGKDGRNGKDGKDGTGIDEVAVGDDGNLYVGFDDGRVINAGRVRGEDGKDGKPGKDGKTIIGGGGSSVPATTAAQETFETVSKNLKAIAATFTYGVDGLEVVTYANGIVKTLAYSPSGLASVTLSGSTPSGISLVKTFNYSGENLTGFSYT